MKNFDEKTLSNIYSFDGVIDETIKTFFKVYGFKLPPENEIYKLTEIIRDTLLEITDDDEIFYLDTYCKNAIFYARFYVHSVVLLSSGYETVNKFYNVEHNLDFSYELPPQTVEKAAKILIKVLDDYYFDVVEFIKNNTLNPTNFSYLVRFIVGDCQESWKKENLESEELFLLFFQEKSYGFAKFLATYIAISNGEPLRVRGNANKSTEEKIFDWVFNRGN